MSDYLDPNNEELLKDFFSEAQMQVDALESNILALENDPGDTNAVDEVFRAAHTLKGAAATVQMSELAEFTHVVEDTLDEIRSGNISVTGDVVDLLLRAIDVIKDMLAERSNGSVYDDDISQLRDGLKALSDRKTASQSKDAAKPVAEAPSSAAPEVEEPAEAEAPPDTSPTAAGGALRDLSEYEQLELMEAAESGKPVYRVRVQFDESNPMNTVGGIQVFAAFKPVGRVLRTVPEFEELYGDTFYPQVDYYVSSDVEASTLKKTVAIPDVTVGSTITVMGAGDDTGEGEAAPEEAAAPAPASEGAGRPAATVSSEPSKRSGEEPRDTEEKAIAAARADEDEQAEAASAPEQELRRQAAAGSILRVDSRRIDNLLNLVSETVINKASFNQTNNEFTEDLSRLQTAQGEFREGLKELFDSLPGYLEQIQKGGSVKDVKKDLIDRFGGLYGTFDGFESSLKTTVSKFRNTAQNLGRITGDLQEGVMRIRMVPISQIFSRFPRLVRDLSKSLKKTVNLVIEGEDTELDKSVIEDLLDPLIHCVRNSIDHGIEAPDDRAEAGKPEEGTVHLKASNEGNMILIEIQDDGRGIDVQAVRDKAVARGVIHPNKALTDVEAFSLIFDPGFSTAAKVTNISGRGVGLDVVRKQIEKLNGSVTVSSEQGVGTKFTIKIPLTLAIIQGLLVRVGKEMYAIPITSVLDSHRIRPSDIRMIDNYEVFNVRDDVISLLRLNRIFNIPTDEDKDYYFVVIVGSGEKKMGLVVDSLIGEEDVVIKPLRDHYTNAPGIAGANITGDGTVSLIIDVSQLLELGLKTEMELRKRREATIG
jgi:two-component system chemotaxis sensor kinase CheA